MLLILRQKSIVTPLLLLTMWGAASSLLATELPFPLSDNEAIYEAHEAVFTKSKYPSAAQCKNCHPKQYREWSVSQHAYAQLSPVFMAMQNTINARTSGTNGDFCIRCHTQPGMNLGESTYSSNLERSEIAREGVTCITCHRKGQNDGKVSGRFALEEGDLTQPVLGPAGNKILAEAIEDKKTFRLAGSKREKGRKVHVEAKQFFGLTTSGFCGSCHDVTNVDGFRLEEAFSEYKHSPAAKRGESCQDCHMGSNAGKKSQYGYGPAAIVNEHETKPRKLTNHYFAGPDYPIIHPGIFPHNPELQELALIDEWLLFDVDAGWGTEAFEATVSEEANNDFPEPWDTAEARFEARELIDEQLKLLDWAKSERQQVLSNGYGLADTKVLASTTDGLEFTVAINNKTDGHNVPTGFTAERLVFVEVNVINPNGNTIYQSGDRDPNGDVRNSHSLYVHHGELPLDDALLSLQSIFLVRTERGGEREQIIPINRSPDPRPFVRPQTFSTILQGGPSTTRIHKQGIPPLGQRAQVYKVNGLDGELMPGTYTIQTRLIAQMVPVNLIAEIQHVGFDYGLSAKEVAKRVVEGAHILQEKEITVVIN